MKLFVQCIMHEYPDRGRGTNDVVIIFTVDFEFKRTMIHFLVFFFEKAIFLSLLSCSIMDHTLP